MLGWRSEKRRPVTAPSSLLVLLQEHAADIDRFIALQFLFDKFWSDVKVRCSEERSTAGWGSSSQPRLAPPPVACVWDKTCPPTHPCCPSLWAAGRSPHSQPAHCPCPEPFFEPQEQCLRTQPTPRVCGSRTTQALRCPPAALPVPCALLFPLLRQAYANSRGVRLVGDMPIYVGGHSADVWASRHLFELTGELPRSCQSPEPAVAGGLL